MTVTAIPVVESTTRRVTSKVKTAVLRSHQATAGYRCVTVGKVNVRSCFTRCRMIT